MTVVVGCLLCWGQQFDRVAFRRSFCPGFYGLFRLHCSSAATSLSTDLLTAALCSDGESLCCRPSEVAAAATLTHWFTLRKRFLIIIYSDIFFWAFRSVSAQHRVCRTLLLNVSLSLHVCDFLTLDTRPPPAPPPTSTLQPHVGHTRPLGGEDRTCSVHHLLWLSDSLSLLHHVHTHTCTADLFILPAHTHTHTHSN